jgi:cytochrome oxidase assembly protein ShyY1
MRRLPILSTLIVLAAALLMVRLGAWQLERRAEKADLLARFAHNGARPPVPLATMRPVTDADLFRRVIAPCARIAGWTAEAGRDARGTTGWRHIARCDAGVTVDMGVSATADPPGWQGGTVRGVLVWASDQTPLIARLFARPPPRRPMIVSAEAAPGLAPSAPPDPATVPNNHLAYAVQWFVFAALAMLIYAILLWRRRRVVAPAGQHR